MTSLAALVSFLAQVETKVQAAQTESSLPSRTLGVFVTIISGAVVALLTLVLKDWWDGRKKAILQLEDKAPEPFPQIVKDTVDCNYYRLVVINNSNYEAKNVVAEVRGLQKEGKDTENFLSTPLRWTHINVSKRNILPHRKALLDVAVFQITHVKDHRNKFVITNYPDIEYLPEYTELREGTNIIKIEISADNADFKTITVPLSWSGNFSADHKPKINGIPS